MLFVIFVFFTNVENVKSTVFSSLIFCGEKIIPSLFPFMVIFSFFLYLSVFVGSQRAKSNKLFQIFGICKKYFLHIVFGSLCGFVVGARMISEDYDENRDSNASLNSSIALSSNAGIGFVVGTVGMKLWGDFLFGIFLFFSQIILALIINKLLFNDVNFDTTSVKKERVPLFSAFIRSVTSSASTIINISAFVVFFSVLISTISSFFNIKNRAFLFILLEFCQGSFYSVSMTNTLMCAFCTGFVVGFGGLCAHFQIFSVCEGLPLNRLKFTIFKFIQGMFCGIFSFLYVFITKIEPIKASFLNVNGSYTHLIVIGILMLFFALFNKKLSNTEKI